MIETPRERHGEDWGAWCNRTSNTTTTNQLLRSSRRRHLRFVFVVSASWRRSPIAPPVAQVFLLRERGDTTASPPHSLSLPHNSQTRKQRREYRNKNNNNRCARASASRGPDASPHHRLSFFRDARRALWSRRRWLPAAPRLRHLPSRTLLRLPKNGGRPTRSRSSREVRETMSRL